MSVIRTSETTFRVAQADHGPTPSEGAAADPHAPDATHAGTEASGAGHKGTFPPFAPESFLSQLIWLAITFTALYFILSRIALPRIGSILADRQGRIAADLAEADRLKRESEAAGLAYEKALAEARAQARTIAGEKRDAVAREADSRRKAKESELAEKLAQAEAQIGATKTAALANVRGIATEAASAIVQHLTGIIPASAELERALDSALGRRPTP